VQGVDNTQGNIELSADWDIGNAKPPKITLIAGGTLRPRCSPQMQQVRAKVEEKLATEFAHQFKDEAAVLKLEWDPIYGDEEILADANPLQAEQGARDVSDDRLPNIPWRLVRGLEPRDKPQRTQDMLALEAASPEAGAFVLVSLKRRQLRER
jgi:hypothetical protein